MQQPSARDCENDLHVRGDSCHACGRDPATQTDGKKYTDLVQNGNNMKISNWQITVALLI